LLTIRSTSGAWNIDPTGVGIKYRDARIPVEAHVFARCGHRFNIGNRLKLATLKHWPDRLADWMADNDILSPKKR